MTISGPHRRELHGALPVLELGGGGSHLAPDVHRVGVDRNGEDHREGLLESQRETGVEVSWDVAQLAGIQLDLLIAREHVELDDDRLTRGRPAARHERNVLPERGPDHSRPRKRVRSS